MKNKGKNLKFLLKNKEIKKEKFFMQTKLFLKKIAKNKNITEINKKN
ncbi:hypothetical protein [uncultured Methanobrevibacter sp.]|nr:hypothetical protein [uncultured Methanobrevibacter sp.]